jgi:hypothetical protein
MAEVVLGELSRISCQLVTGHTVKHVCHMLKLIACDDVLSTTITVKVRGPGQFVLLIKSYSVLVVFENVAVDVHDGSEELTKIANIFLGSCCNVVSETGPT